jgi:hypothetical protein
LASTLPTTAMPIAPPSSRERSLRAAEMVERELIDRVAARLAGPAARDRAAAFSTGAAGLIFLRYILRAEPVASLPPGRLVTLLAPALQTALGPEETV